MKIVLHLLSTAHPFAAGESTEAAHALISTNFVVDSCSLG